MSKPQQQAKVKTPLHLRLTPEDWEECCKMLNPAEIKVFIWIRASDPYGDRELKFSCSKLGEKLGLHKSSVSRALKSLDVKGLIEIDFEDVRVTQKVSNRRLTLLCKEENGNEQEHERENESVAPVQRGLHLRNVGCADATQVVPMQRELSPRNDGIYIDRVRSNTLSDISNPPDRSGEGGENAYEEPERSQSKSASLASKPEESTRQVKASSEDKSSGGACNDLQQLLDSLGVLSKAQSLLDKMEELNVAPCPGYSAERIAGVIKECHLSQLWGALRHIEETWESIRNPTAIFCSKAPKMPVEVEHRLPDFDRAAYEEKLAQATTPEASKAYIEKIKSEKIKAIASSSGDKRLRKFADLIPSMPSLDSKPNTDFDTDYAAEQRRLARQMMEEADGDASS